MNNSKPIIIIQARTGSSRLPSKMIMPFYGNKSILEILIERIRADYPDLATQVVVATTMEERDDVITSICHNMGVACFRGNENDVLERFIQCANFYNTDKMIRICADNVFLDTESLGRLYKIMDNEDYDYVSFRTSHMTPSIKTHFGFWAEGVKLSALENVKTRTSEPIYHEHVTNFIYQHDGYTLKWLPIDAFIESHKNLRLTIDTSDDFRIQASIYSYMMENAIDITPRNIIGYLDNHAEIYEIMRKNIIENTK